MRLIDSLKSCRNGKKLLHKIRLNVLLTKSALPPFESLDVKIISTVANSMKPPDCSGGFVTKNSCERTRRVAQASNPNDNLGPVKFQAVSSHNWAFALRANHSALLAGNPSYSASPYHGKVTPEPTQRFRQNLTNQPSGSALSTPA